MEIWLSRFQSTWCHLPGPSSATDIQSLEKQLCLPLTSPQNSSSESGRYICVKWCHSKEMIVTEWRPESALCHPQDGLPTKNIHNFFKDNFNSYRWIKLFLITLFLNFSPLTPHEKPLKKKKIVTSDKPAGQWVPRLSGQALLLQVTSRDPKY